MPILKSFVVNGVEYRTQTEYFFQNNPHRADTTNTEIKMFCYHTIPQYREQIRMKNKMRYRNKKNGEVRLYTKHDFTNRGSMCLVCKFFLHRIHK